jgi:hypothetical protein
LSGVVEAADMLEPSNADKLMEEVDRYLAAVDLFRELACEPTWRAEAPPETRRSATAVITTPALNAELH